jgi:hypothetical protein
MEDEAVARYIGATGRSAQIAVSRTLELVIEKTGDDGAAGPLSF